MLALNDLPNIKRFLKHAHDNRSSCEWIHECVLIFVCPEVGIGSHRNVIRNIRKTNFWSWQAFTNLLLNLFDFKVWKCMTAICSYPSSVTDSLYYVMWTIKPSAKILRYICDKYLVFAGNKHWLPRVIFGVQLSYLFFH